jgi:glycosyltransferase involved in cell wall biosynthesis
MKNIAIIITKLNGGGAERCASNLSVELSKKCNVKLIAFDATNITYPYGGELIDLAVGNSNGLVHKVWNVFRRVHKVRAIKKKYNIDCAISLLDGPNIVNVLSTCGEKTVVSVRNMLSHEPMSALRKMAVKFASMHSDVTVSVSELVKYDLINSFGIPGEKITTVYNHCDAQLLRNLCRENPCSTITNHAQVNFVTMGRLNKQKGQWHLIRAFQKVVKEIPDAHLYIMGEGEMEESLKNLISELHLTDAVTMTGYIRNPHGIYSQCEIFVFPSLFEGLGNVLLEALAFDMPIISSDCEAGPREILAPDTNVFEKTTGMELAQYGVLVPVCDGGHINAVDPLTEQEEFLADAMIYLHNHPELREKYAMLAKERMENFDKQRITNEWLNIIERR